MQLNLFKFPALVHCTCNIILLIFTDITTKGKEVIGLTFSYERNQPRQLAGARRLYVQIQECEFTKIDRPGIQTGSGGIFGLTKKLIMREGLFNLKYLILQPGDPIWILQKRILKTSGGFAQKTLMR